MPEPRTNSSASAAPHIVIVGGGFGGLYCARQLRGAPVRITLIDRTNHHVFQPLLYQVATGGLSPANIAVPLRGVFRRQKNATVLLGEVTDFAPAERMVRLADGGTVEYDYLVVAAGMQNFYFGRDEWEPHAPGLKTLDDATEMRRRILTAFEAAEREPLFAEQVKWLTFTVVGAGPTGLELAGTLAEIARDTLRHDFRRINTQKARILLLDGSDRVLPTYVPSLSESAKRQVEALGVEVHLQTTVVGVDPDGVRVKSNGVEQLIPAKTVLWGAGVRASPLGQKLADATGAKADRAGRVLVSADCTIENHPNIFVIGDLAHQKWRDDQLVPGVAPAAIQHGSYVARVIRRRLQGRATPPFQYADKGSLATIGRAAAVADIAGWRFSGYFAWLAWLLIHIFFLIHFQNRLLVMIQWAWNYFTFARSARLITGRSR